MKILFITYDYLNMYKDIEKEIKRQGHELTTIVYANDIKHDPYYGENKKFLKLRKWLFVDHNNIHDKYWKKRILKEPCLSEFYDVLFVLNGTFVGKKLIEHLKSINPSIRKILYTWDTIKYYRFDRLQPYFDKCYSFDLNDCNEYPSFKLLPIYYKVYNKFEYHDYKYDLMFVGSNHDGRYSMVKRLIPQLKKEGISFFIKIYGQKRGGQSFVKELSRKIFSKRNDKYKDSRDFAIEPDVFDIKIYKPIQNEKYEYLSSVSRCILDTQRQTQSGLTARFMWALGNGKKIITTNRWALQYDFVNPKQVCIIDENAPHVSHDFIFDEEMVERDEDRIIKYRIDNWVKTLLF